jgi:hypothetical protein
VLSRMFGPKVDEVTGEWRKLHNEELCDLYSFPSIIRIMNQYIYVETSVRNKCRCSFYCALLTLHVSVPIGGYLQVVL